MFVSPFVYAESVQKLTLGMARGVPVQDCARAQNQYPPRSLMILMIAAFSSTGIICAIRNHGSMLHTIPYGSEANSVHKRVLSY